MTLDCDLLVVGGGPGGSATAEHAKRENPDMQVILVEKRDKPHGTCAGGCGAIWQSMMSAVDEIPRHLRETEIHRVVIHGPTESTEITKDDLGDDQLGWVLDRAGWDEWLLQRAAAEGAWVHRNTEFKGIERANGSWVSTVENQNGPFDIAADYVVDASGHGAVVAKKVGMEVDERPEHIHLGYQETIPVPDDHDMNAIQMWFQKDPLDEEGKQFACPGGYLWDFPARHGYYDYGDPHTEGKYTRLGCGVDLKRNKQSEWKSKRVLERFKDAKPRFDAEPISVNGGRIPTGHPMDTSLDQLFLVGDAGRHVSSLHGGGVLFARKAGEAAGKTAALGESGDEFDERWQESIGWTVRAHGILRDLLYDLDNDEIDLLVRILDDFDPEVANPFVEIPRAAKKVMKHPRFAGKAAMQSFKGLIETARA